jgi:hypothetical protein
VPLQMRIGALIDFENGWSMRLRRLNCPPLWSFGRLVLKTDDGFDNTALNILTCVKKLSENCPEVKEDYDFLSEKTHPNGLGALHYFWDNGDDDIIKFAMPADRGGALAYLIKAGGLMGLMEHRISRLEPDLQAYCRREAEQWQRVLTLLSRSLS